MNGAEYKQHWLRVYREILRLTCLQDNLNIRPEITIR